MYKFKNLQLNDKISNLGKDIWWNTYFISGNLQMRNKLMKTFSILLLVREMQIPTRDIPLSASIRIHESTLPSANEAVGLLEWNSVWRFLIKLNMHLPKTEQFLS